MSKKMILLLLMLLILSIVGSVFFLTGDNTQNKNPSVETHTHAALENNSIRKKKKAQDPQQINEQSIFALINNFRDELNLELLTQSSTLVQIAATRAFDMRDREYSSAVSPLGETVESVAAQAGYKHLHIKETRIKGSFSGLSEFSAELLNPEHAYQKIFSAGYVQAGIAIGPGYESADEVIVVIILAVPVSACPRLNPVLLEELEKNKQLLQQLGVNFEEELDSDNPTEESLSAEVLELLEVTRLLNSNSIEATETYQDCLRTYSESVAATSSEPLS